MRRENTSISSTETIHLETSGSSRADVAKNRVYLDYYQLKEAPFSITPDPEYLFYSATHRNAIDKLLYGIKSHMGFLLLVGEVGTGKTTICRALMDDLADQASTVYVINPSLSGRELISSILDDLGVDYSENATKKQLIDALNTFLLNQGENRPVVIVIDDAQTMPVDALEDLRLLSNLETDKQKLLQILLAGQPELLDRLSQPDMRQLKQRVGLICRLDVLSSAEVKGYIARRLLISGDNGLIQFKNDALRRIYALSGGIPRLINRICDYALTAGYVDDSREIYRTHVKKAVKELEDLEATEQKRPKQRFGLWRWLSALALAFFIFCGVLAAVWYFAPEYLVATLGDQLARHPQVKTFSIEKEDEAVGPVNAQPSEDKPPPATHVQPGDAAEPNSADNTALREDVYIIRVASFRTMQRVEKAMAQLRRQGVDSYWEMVDLGERGKWFGVYTGRFRTLEAAKQFKQEKALLESIIEHRYPEQRLNAQTPGISKPGTP